MRSFHGPTLRQQARKVGAISLLVFQLTQGKNDYLGGFGELHRHREYCSIFCTELAKEYLLLQNRDRNSQRQPVSEALAEARPNSKKSKDE